MIWLKQANVKDWVCAQLAREIECIGNNLLCYDRKRPNEARAHLPTNVVSAILNTADTTFVGRFLAFYLESLGLQLHKNQYILCL